VQNVEPLGFTESYTSKVPFFHKLFLSRVENFGSETGNRNARQRTVLLLHKKVHKKPPTKGGCKN